METPQELWARCSARLDPRGRSRGFQTRCIGNSTTMVNQLLDLIISGQKTGTASLPDELARLGPLPVAGDYLILTRYDGSAACLLELVSVEAVPFNGIGPQHRALEAPDARDPDCWESVHKEYWLPLLESRGQAFSEAQPVLVQGFKLLAVADF